MRKVTTLKKLSDQVARNAARAARGGARSGLAIAQISAKQIRRGAEQLRRSAEKLRRGAEQYRPSAKQLRHSAEQLRRSADLAKSAGKTIKTSAYAIASKQRLTTIIDPSDPSRPNAANETKPQTRPSASEQIIDEAFGFDAGQLPGASDRAFHIGLAIVLLSVVSGLATYLILTGLTPIVPRSNVVITVLFINLILVVAMIAIISWQSYGLVQAWKAKVAGARLHVRIVLLFSIIAAVPAIFLAISATTTFSRSLDNLFSRSTRIIVANSLEVAQAYLAEHGQVIRNDIVNMGKDLDDTASFVGNDNFKLRAQLIAQAGLRALPIAYIIDATGRVLVTGVDDVKVPYVPPEAKLIKQAEGGRVPLLLPVGTYRVAAVTRLNNFPGRYLYVARRVNPKVIRQVRRTEAGVERFNQLRHRRGGMKFAHGLMYFMISLTALLAAIWVGMWFAGRLVAPIRRLIGAAQLVSTGNLDIRLPLKRGEGDLRRLSQTFNHMTAQLKSQHDELVSANEQLDERRVFMEATLSGVSAGVIGLDGEGKITLANRSAEELLGQGKTELAGKTLADIVPEFGELISGASAHKLRDRSQAQVKLEIDGVERSFAVRAIREQSVQDDDQGWVVTFDDITELVAAQRTSAWADVAQRIAHEIKNPLTPIQLSAERIQRKYGKVITEDREVFEKCTETIIRQVGDVARMVDEFSSFARMPKPQMANCDLREVVREPVFLFEMANSHIDFKLHLPDDKLILSCDRRLISQVVTNLVKNASEAIASLIDAADGRGPAGQNEPVVLPKDYRGFIEVFVRGETGRAMVEVVDNGIGLPKQNRGRLIEPYVTNREKGTGLGLAIVQKITEQHDGTLVLEDAPITQRRKRGALVRLTLPMPAVDSNKPNAKPNAKSNAKSNTAEASAEQTSLGKSSTEAVLDKAQSQPEPKLNPEPKPDPKRTKPLMADT